MQTSEVFLEVIRTRRSVRKFKPDPVPDDYVTKIVDAARWAQSGANAQPWEFIVVKDKGTINKIVAIYAAEQKEQWHTEKTRLRELRQPHYTDGPPPEAPGFKDAPVLIFVCGDPRTVQATVLAADFQSGEGGWGAHFFKAIGNATQIMGLTARALGIGAQWVSLDDVLESRLKALLGVPEELEIHTIVPIGYPAYEPPPPFRRELKDVVHFEKYDMSKFRSAEKIYDFLLELRERTRSAYKRREQT